MQADDLRLLGIPRWRLTIAIVYPYHARSSKDFPILSNQVMKLAESRSVARVRPRTSKGITDLLLPQTSIRYTQNSPSKKLTFNKVKASYLAGWGLVR
jgi:hypothetical protein